MLVVAEVRQRENPVEQASRKQCLLEPPALEPLLG